MSSIYKNTIAGLMLGAIPKIIGKKTALVQCVGIINLIDVLFGGTYIERVTFSKPSVFDEVTEIHSQGYEATFTNYSRTENRCKYIAASIGIAQLIFQQDLVSQNDLQVALAPACCAHIAELFCDSEKRLVLVDDRGDSSKTFYLTPDNFY